MSNDGITDCSFLYTPGPTREGRLHGILKTPVSNSLTCCKSSGTKKRVRISCEKDIIPAPKYIKRTARSLSPLGSLSQSQSLCSSSKKGFRPNVSFNACDRLSIQALLDPDVNITEWSDRMATPPKTKNIICDNESDDSPKKGVARALFAKQASLLSPSFIDFNDNSSQESLSPPVIPCNISPPVLSCNTRNIEQSKSLVSSTKPSYSPDDESWTSLTLLQDSSLLRTVNHSPSVVSCNKCSDLRNSETMDTSGIFSLQTTFSDLSKTHNKSDSLLSPPMLSGKKNQLLFNKCFKSQSTPCAAVIERTDKSNTTGSIKQETSSDIFLESVSFDESQVNLSPPVLNNKNISPPLSPSLFSNNTPNTSNDSGKNTTLNSPKCKRKKYLDKSNLMVNMDILTQLPGFELDEIENKLTSLKKERFFNSSYFKSQGNLELFFQDFETKGNVKTTFTKFQNTKGQFSENSFNEAKNPIEDISKKELQADDKPFLGFQSGSGKKVEISEKSLKEAKKVFEDIGQKEQHTNEKPFIGFQTGSGKKVAISEKSLKEAKKLFEDISQKEQHTNEKPFIGFQTGSGKKVEISEKSLKEAKKLFEDISQKEQHTNEKPFIGFQTGSGKNVAISEKSLKEAKKLFEDISQKEQRTDEKPFLGFQTGSGKKVEISEKSLKEAKKVFEDIGQKEQHTNEKPFLGFQTGSGKKVEISEKSLKEAKKVFEDIGQVESRDNRKNIEFEKIFDVNANETPLHSKGFSGFESSTKNPQKNPRCNLKDPACNLQKGKDNYNESKDSFHRHPGNFSTPLTKYEGLRKRPRNVLYTTPNRYQKDRRCSFDTPMRPCHADIIKEEKKEENNESAVLHSTSSTFITPFKTTDNTPFVNTTPVTKERKINLSFCPFRKKPINTSSHTPKSDHVQYDGRLYKQKKENSKSFEEFVNYYPPHIYSADELQKYGINDAVLLANSENAVNFQFSASQFFSDVVLKQGYAIVGDNMKLKFNENNMIGVNEFKHSFIESENINSNLVSSRWVENHYRWIILKLVNYERKYPEQFASSCVTPVSVMLHLQYRYDKEINHAERSCLKKIYERDDVASRRMVLFVSSLFPTKPSNDGENVIELSDGWYSIKACLDSYLKYWLTEGKIAIGTKLLIYGAELFGSDQACDPLECPDSLMLKLHGNSTRRASWETKLGYQRVKVGFCIPVSSINAEGGLIGRTDLIILRKYPMQWMEKMEGKYFFRSRIAEDICQKHYETKKMDRMEKIYADIHKQQVNNGVGCKSTKRKGSRKLKELQQIRNGSDLYDLIQNAADPMHVEAALSSSQKEIVSEFHRRQNDIQQEKMKRLFDDEWQKVCEEFPERKSVELQRFRVTDDDKSQSTSSTILTVWKPTSDILETWDEGVKISCFNLMSSISRQRNSSFKVQLSTTSKTKYGKIHSNHPFIPRKVTSLQKLYTNFIPAFHEVDIIGYVIRVVPEVVNKGSEQLVYISDVTMHVVAVRFPTGLQDNHLSNLLTHSALVGFMNLSLPNITTTPSKSRIPNLLYNDFSCAYANPKEKHLVHAMNQSRNLIKDLKTFIEKCEVALEERLSNNQSHVVSEFHQSHSLSEINQSHSLSESHVNKTPSEYVKPTSMSLPSEKLQNRHKLQMKKRLSLERYGEPNSLLPLPQNVNSPSSMSQFKMPTPNR